ncbi:sigma-70 family RNA polymerase sigma factor [Sedimenticola sp.]|uniref:sigma-70 family RNA polymerase sigma factor n=1 Tax=Sedimenticola sp. TaxID=1940285 RepID=UPI003D0A7D1E
MSNLALVQNWNEAPAPSKQDDNRHFNELVSQYAQDLQRYAHWLAGDKHTAEDLVQETLLRAWKSLHNLQNPKAAKGWLFTILRRENARRFERKQLQESDILLETLESNDNYYDTSTEAFVLRRAIDDLPAEYREPLVHQVIGGYSQKEIAEKLGISSAGVGTRLFRARNKLKEALVA